MQTLSSRWILAAVGVTFVALAFIQRSDPETKLMAADAKEDGPMVAHNVYFTLKESTPEGRERLAEACHKYLSGHEGTVFYAAGPVDPDLKREVNVTDFDIGLHVIFKNRAAHDVHQDHPRHLQFIEENKATWKQVRVFDSDVTSG